MARSVKRNPIYTDGHDSLKRFKRFSSKAVRKYKGDISNGNFYKKIYWSYNIHDYISRWTWKEAKKDYEIDKNGIWHKRFPTLREFYHFWRKYYKNK